MLSGERASANSGRVPRDMSPPDLYASPAGHEDRAPRSLRILVVDDDRDAVLSVMMLLREEGHEARGLHNGNDVMAALRDFEADVVLLDIGLPDRNGYDVARQVRAR